MMTVLFLFFILFETRFFSGVDSGLVKENCGV